MGLTNLRYLSIVHLPRVHDLGPLRSLTSLLTLSLQTLPSWDSSGKRTVVDSLEPLLHLRRLEHLELLGVVPPDRHPDPLARIGSLKTARLHGFDREAQAEFFAKTPVTNEFAPRAEF